ncbi:MAG: hypothetical protein ACRC0X_05740, partial [Brevinema sp.]
SQKDIVITSTSRTAKEQAKEIYKSVFNANGQLAKNSMYEGYSGQFVEQELKKGTLQKEIEEMLEQGISGIPQNLNGVMVVFTGFNHIDAPKNTCDIGINNNPWSKTSFVAVLEIFINQRKFLNTQSLPLGKGKETDCHHLVILV